MSGITIKDPYYVNAEGTRINATVTIPGVGEDLPYTFAPNDVSGLGSVYFPRILSGEFGPIAPYVPPAPEA